MSGQQTIHWTKQRIQQDPEGYKLHLQELQRQQRHNKISQTRQAALRKSATTSSSNVAVAVPGTIAMGLGGSSSNAPPHPTHMTTFLSHNPPSSVVGWGAGGGSGGVGGIFGEWMFDQRAEVAQQLQDEICAHYNPNATFSTAANFAQKQNFPNAQQAEFILNDALCSVIEDSIMKTINKIVLTIKSAHNTSPNALTQKILAKLERQPSGRAKGGLIASFTDNFKTRIFEALRSYSQDTIDLGVRTRSSKYKHASYTKLFEDVFGLGIRQLGKSGKVRNEILNNVGDNAQCKKILQHRLTGKLPFLYNYSKAPASIAPLKEGDTFKFYDPRKPPSYSEAFQFEKKYGRCYLCGQDYCCAPTWAQKTPECEHVLSIFLALRLMHIVRGDSYSGDEWNILNREYEFSHRCCNQIKSQISFISQDFTKSFPNGPFIVNTAAIDDFYDKLFAGYQNRSWNCHQIVDSIFQNFDPNGNRARDLATFKHFMYNGRISVSGGGETPAATLNKRIKLIVDVLNYQYAHNAALYRDELDKNPIQTTQGVSIQKIAIFQDPRLAFGLHLCHSMIKAMSVLTVEQFITVLANSGLNKDMFTQKEHAQVNSLTGSYSSNSAFGYGARRGGQKKSAKKRKQKGGNKEYEDILKIVKARFLENMEKPSIKTKDIFKTLVLRYGFKKGKINVPSVLWLYNNNGNIEIKLRHSGEILPYDSPIIDNLIDKLYKISRQNTSSKQVPTSIKTGISPIERAKISPMSQESSPSALAYGGKKKKHKKRKTRKKRKRKTKRKKLRKRKTKKK